MMARSFVGVPFKHQGRTRALGIDCVGLPLCVAESYGLKDVHGVPLLGNDENNYGPQPQSDIVYEGMKKRLVEVSELKEGCVLALRLPTVACHSAIATLVQGEWHIIHSDRKYGKVVEEPLTEKWRSRIKGIFDFPNIE
jgi:hypothetical protein